MSLSGKRVAILVEFNYEDTEVWYPLLRFRENKAKTFCVGPKADFVYKSKKGYPVKSDKSIDDVTFKDMDCLIIPGGFAPDYWRRDARFTKLVKDCMDNGVIVASICHGPWLLVSAKVLKGKKATCFISIKDDVINAGATYLDQEVVVDDNLVTSRTPMDIPAWCLAIVDCLEKQVYNNES